MSSLTSSAAPAVPMNAIQLCTVMPLPDDRIIEAAIKSVQENPDNAPLRGNEGGAGVFPHEPFAMAVLTETKWKPGRTLRVRFVEGDPGVQAKVKDFAKRWEDHASVKLDFVADGDADLRISFSRPGSWSYLGTHALAIPAAEPTMNYGWLTPTTPDDEYSRVVLHEFGHALGCIHEHQHPEAGIPWDREKVYQYYRVTQGWDKEKTDRNVLGRYTREITNYSEYDSTSIMQYSVPNELTIGDFAIGWNRELSGTDEEFIGVIYPAVPKDFRELPLGEVLQADIGKHGEEDVYRFTVGAGKPRRHLIETSGHTDVVMALFGPDVRTRLLAWDDDSGRGYNAQIIRRLTPGDYFVRVRHYSPTGTGSYGIKLQALG